VEFRLKTDFIELDNLLKTMGFAVNGTQAREQIQSSQIKVNGAVENRIRRKLRLGDTVEFKTEKIEIIKNE